MNCKLYIAKIIEPYKHQWTYYSKPKFLTSPKNPDHAMANDSKKV